MTEFKVGDRVVVNDVSWYNRFPAHNEVPWVREGATGTVQHLVDSTHACIGVAIDGDPEQDFAWAFGEHEIAHAPVE